VLFVVPFLVFLLVFMRFSPVLILFMGALSGAFIALAYQPEVLKKLGEGVSLTLFMKIKLLAKAMWEGANIADVPKESALYDMLITTGMRGMLPTLFLIGSAAVLGGSMEHAGLLAVFTRYLGKVKSWGALFTLTAITCFLLNMILADQYLTILLGGKLFAPLFQKNNLAPENLSRSLEDTATVTSPLIPWNSCGATQASVLGVSVLTYAPYCFFNIFSPLVGILLGVMGWRIKKIVENPIKKVNFARDKPRKE